MLLGLAMLVAVAVLTPASHLTTVALHAVAAVLFLGGAGWALALALDRNASRGFVRRSRSGEGHESSTQEADTPAEGAGRGAPGPSDRPIQNPARPTIWSGAVFDLIEWRRFEALCEHLFAQAGLEMRSQSRGAEEGIDIWLYSRSQPGTAISLVQCRCWGERTVKVAELRELLGSMSARQVTQGVFATTSAFSLDAVRFAQENGIQLLDRIGLLRLIQQREPAQQGELLALVTEGEFWVPTCARCGVKMHRQQQPPRKGGASWGCANFPVCEGVAKG